MTPDEVVKEISDLRERVEDLEDEADTLKRLPEALAELRGMVKALKDVVVKIDGGADRIERANSLKTAVQFAAVVIVPILVALIGGYFLVKSQGVSSGR